MEANGKQAGHTDVYFYHKEKGRRRMRRKRKKLRKLGGTSTCTRTGWTYSSGKVPATGSV